MTTDTHPDRDEECSPPHNTRHRPPAAAIEHIGRRAASIRRREVETALAKLETRGGLDDDQRAVVRRLATRITCRLLAPPVAALRDGDDRQVATAASLFGHEGTDDP